MLQKCCIQTKKGIFFYIVYTFMFRYNPRQRIMWYNKLSISWQNQQMACEPTEDSDQPGHPPSLIRVFVVCSLGSLGPKLSSCRKRRLWSDWADAQAYFADQAGRMPRLIWVFAGRTCHFEVAQTYVHVRLTLSCLNSSNGHFWFWILENNCPAVLEIQS